MRATGRPRGAGPPNHQPPPSPQYPNNTSPIPSSPVQYRRFPICTPIPKPTPPNSNLTRTARPYYPFPSYTFWPRIDGSGQLLNRNKTKGIRDNTVTATTAKNRVIETIDGASAGYYFRPVLFATSLSGEQHPPHPIPPYYWAPWVVLFRLRGKRDPQQRPVATYDADVATQT